MTMASDAEVCAGAGVASGAEVTTDLTATILPTGVGRAGVTAARDDSGVLMAGVVKAARIR